MEPRSGRRGEHAGAHETFGVGRTKAGVQALQLVEGVEQLLGKDWIGQTASRHSLIAGTLG